MPFTSLGLSPELNQTVKALGYKSPTSIQIKAIPTVLSGRDLIAIAQTGTGKTAAFTLPMLQNLLSTPRSRPKLPRALILTPTRELALQVYQDLKGYSKSTGLKSMLLHGGVSYTPQFEKIDAGVDIIVATPGRLRDHIERKTVHLYGLEFLVIDEADRMLDMGFSEDVGVIIGRSDKKRQTQLFSATFPEQVRRLAQKFLINPASIEVSPQKVTAQNVTHLVHPVSAELKDELLFEVIHKHLTEQILIFARTKSKVDEVAKDLISRGLNVIATHGDRTQAHRTKAIARFKDGRSQILVATDIAARGIDAPDLGIVINYELPNEPEDYVHRIGRTGRAGKSGIAISLVMQSEARYLAAVEKAIKFKIDMVKFEGFTLDNFTMQNIGTKSKGRPGKPPLNRSQKQHPRRSLKAKGQAKSGGKAKKAGKSPGRQRRR